MGDCPIGMIPLSSPIIIGDRDFTLKLDAQSFDRLGRFQTRTCLTIGPRSLAGEYQKEAIKLAITVTELPRYCLRANVVKHPYLMHVVQALTTLHDRWIATPFQPKATLEENWHWSQAAAMLNQKLSLPIPPEDRDAVWATGNLFSIISFCAIEAETPEEAWPLKAGADLHWLKMGDGKKVIWQVANPLMPGSVFQKLAQEIRDGPMLIADLTSDVEGIPPAFVQLYDLGSDGDNPYDVAVRALVPLLPIECNDLTLARFFGFIMHFEPAFVALVLQKDPRALVLMALWHAKICDSQWWCRRRATLECQAICLYLERKYPEDTAIQGLLEVPKMRCGLVAQKSE